MYEFFIISRNIRSKISVSLMPATISAFSDALPQGFFFSFSFFVCFETTKRYFQTRLSLLVTIASMSQLITYQVMLKSISEIYVLSGGSLPHWHETISKAFFYITHILNIQSYILRHSIISCIGYPRKFVLLSCQLIRGEFILN